MAFENSDHEEIASINVIPLVDIILVVLIIFMVTAPMFMKPSINVNLPRAASGDETAPSKLNLTLLADGRILFNGSATTEEALRTKVQAEFEKNSEIQAIISADSAALHGKVVSLMDIVKSIGVKKFAISIEKTK
jgi:biopolymer transport protein ExbD